MSSPSGNVRSTMNRGISCSSALRCQHAGGVASLTGPQSGPVLVQRWTTVTYRALVRVSLLGPLQVDDVPGSVVLGAAKERSLLSALALRPGSIVSTDALIGALWGEDPPAAARKTLQTYVWNLRQALGTEVIVTEPPGYSLQIGPDDVDVGRFRALVREGEAAMVAGDAATASAVLADAMALWRGDPFSGVAPHTGLAGEAVRLHEEHLSALETRVAADL